MAEDYYASIEKIFNAADRNLRVNTAYPVFRKPFEKYLSDADLFRDVHDLSFYIHIPFCEQLCSFCEYTRFQANTADEARYLKLLRQQADGFLSSHRIFEIYGLDIGGGTPTALGDDAFAELMDIQDQLSQAGVHHPGLRKSIEGTFATMTDNKISLIAEHGFRRISVGVQTGSQMILNENHRHNPSLERMFQVRTKIRNAGITRFNIDLMYGLPHLNDSDIKTAVSLIQMLDPEEVTLYETRFNRNGLDDSGITRELQYHQYSLCYDLLTEAGYHARFGRNTFSKYEDEMGISSYLQSRMLDNIPYKGFGISAQSMSPAGLSYGSLKNCRDTNLPRIEAVTEQYNYVLPPEELAGKYVSVALYSGSFRVSVLENILQKDPFEAYLEEMDYLFESGYVKQAGDLIYLTRKGFRYYGAIGALFWSKDQQQELPKESE